MNWFEWAVLTYANRVKPGEDGYETAQKWAAEVSAHISAREVAAEQYLARLRTAQ